MKAAILALFTSLFTITFNAPGASYSGGDGSETNPYRIAVVNDLLTLRDSWVDYDAYFILVNDIDLSGHTFDKALIAPDTDIYEDFHQGAPFAGSFNGNGHINKLRRRDGHALLQRRRIRRHVVLHVVSDRIGVDKLQHVLVFGADVRANARPRSLRRQRPDHVVGLESVDAKNGNVHRRLF